MVTPPARGGAPRHPGTHGKLGPVCDTCCYYQAEARKNSRRKSWAKRHRARHNELNRLSRARRRNGGDRQAPPCPPLAGEPKVPL